MKPVYQHSDGTFGSARLLRARTVRRLRGAARLPQPRALGQLRRPRLPRPARGAPAALEGAARLLAPRVHDRPGALGARPARARLRALDPAAAAPRGHRRLVPAGGHGGPGASRLQGDALRHASAPRPDGRRRATTRTTGSCSSSGPGRRSSTCRAGCLTSAPRRSRRRSGRRCTSRATCARSASASSRSAPTCTAPTRSRVVQLLILYHMVTARAVVSLGGSSTREFDVSTLDTLIAEGGHSPF